MLTTCRFTVLILSIFFLLSCQSVADKYQDQFWVISDRAILYARPSITSKQLKELKFNTLILGRDKNPSASTPKGWLEAKFGDVYGFLERKGIAGEEFYKQIKGMTDSEKDAPVHGAGITGKKVALRLKPENGAAAIQLLKEPTEVDILERILVTAGEKEKAKKQIWYKVRVPDGRVGFVTKNNLKLTPPPELNVYTEVRTPVTWYKLGDKLDPQTEQKVSEYLVTYSSVGSDIATDFTRIELYTCDPKSKQYATNLARSNLYGILPVKITEAENGGKIIEIREHPKGNKGKIHVIKYSYPSPIKIISESVEDAAEKQQ